MIILALNFSKLLKNIHECWVIIACKPLQIVNSAQRSIKTANKSTLLSGYWFFINSFTFAVKLKNTQEVVEPDSIGDFDKLFMEENFHYFDVSDFAEKDINRVNIVSKKYKSNTLYNKSNKE